MEAARPSASGTDITTPAIIVLAVIFGLSILFILTGNVVSFFIFFTLIAILVFVLIHFGFVKIDTNGNQLDITYYPVPNGPPGAGSDGKSAAAIAAAAAAAAAAGVAGVAGASAGGAGKTPPRGAHAPSSASGSPPNSSDVHHDNEVFYVGDNKFTYDQAENVCKAYDAELASYSQIEQAYNAGAEWCGYGWSVGGLALFPTQQASWEKRQSEADETKRKVCGRPGINGGYFEPGMKFGVNCYGRRPDKKPDAKTGSTSDPDADRFIGALKDQLDKINVLPFNKAVWSESEQPGHNSIIPTYTNTTSNASVPSSQKTISQSAANFFQSSGQRGLELAGGVASGTLQFTKDLLG